MLKLLLLFTCTMFFTFTYSKPTRPFQKTKTKRGPLSEASASASVVQTATWNKAPQFLRISRKSLVAVLKLTCVHFFLDYWVYQSMVFWHWLNRSVFEKVTESQPPVTIRRTKQPNGNSFIFVQTLSFAKYLNVYPPTTSFHPKSKLLFFVTTLDISV